MSGNVKFDKWVNDDNSENYKCRAWVNFDGTGTVAIRASGNVSSITDNGTGDYTVNLSTAMVDTNFVSQSTAIYHNTGVSAAMIRQSSVANYTTTSVRLNTGFSYPSAHVMEDEQTVVLTIFR